MGSLPAGNEATLAPQSLASAVVCPAPVPALLFLPETPEPVRLITDPPRHEGVGLYTLYSTLLI